MDRCPFLVAFRSSLTTPESPSDKMFWIRACMQCVWTGSIKIKLSTDIISWYLGTYLLMTPRLPRKIQYTDQTLLSTLPIVSLSWYFFFLFFLWYFFSSPYHFRWSQSHLCCHIFTSYLLVCTSSSCCYICITWVYQINLNLNKVRQRLRRACASLQSQFSIDGSGMSSITAFMLNGLICVTRLKPQLGKRPFCI